LESIPEVTDNIYDYGYRAPRLSADFRLLLQTRDRNPALLDARCTDLSEDGLAAEVNVALQIGESVNLVVTLPGTPASMRIAARVANRQLGGYGFAFIFSSPNERSYIREYLESQHSGKVGSPKLP
jgi:Tfp pilus assembly protein PilZ